MRRREFITLVGGAAAIVANLINDSFAAAASDTKIPHVGILDLQSKGGIGDRQYWSAFREGMHALGYDNGKTVIFDDRWADEDYRRLPTLASELIKLRVRIIVAGSTPVVIAARSVTSQVPIVSPLMADPVGSGFAQSLARPGGNITGLSTLSPELSAKRLEQLKEIVPSLSRVGMLWDQNIQSFALTVRQTEAAARTLGLLLEVHGLHTPDDYNAAFNAMAASRVQGLIVAAGLDTKMTGGDPARLTTAIAEFRLPATYSAGEFVASGGLVSYGPNYPGLFRRAAYYVDRILRGANPAELPVEEPTLFDLRINLKTAKALGLTVPSSLLTRADEVIE
jgi:putative ABC transport system substrate-binding protein